MTIPLMNPRAQYEPYIDQLNAALADVVTSGQFIFGPNVEGFEHEAAEYLGVKHAIGVANGTDALVLVLRAMGIGAGDEVICPAYTFYATNESVAMVGATPVFADVDDQTYTLDLDHVRTLISGRTKAIMPVHLFGQAADMDPLREIAQEHGLKLIEDAAQGWGSRYNGTKVGALGDAATFSFFPTKNLPCFGDGGLVATNDDDLAERVKMLRFHGSKDKKVFEFVGHNSRLDAIQAAVLRIFLKHVDGWNESRAQVAEWYREAGLGELVTLPHVADGRNHIYHVYTVRSPLRDAISAACAERGVGAAVYYNPPSHLQPVFAHLGSSPGDLPVSEAMAKEGLALPMFPTMTEAEVGTVVEAVRSAVPVGAAN